ncbi:MAG: hypothetical protein J7L43_00160 [Candidatus Aenigmarchaeota archaeon]|nr:hypothetical protein [Candidatus Aenigmarchaeota archaeon]
MCNINIVIKKDRIPTAKTLDILNTTSAVSWMTNSDSEGFINYHSKENYTLLRSLKKLSFSGKGWFCASHERIATSGGAKPESNIHPFETKYFLLFHNGVFWEFGDINESDTKQFLDYLTDEYEKHDKNLLKTLKTILPKVSGSFSILLYEKLNDRWVYFKESGTYFYQLKTKEYRVFSTSEEALQLANIIYFEEKGKIKEVQPYTIYELPTFKPLTTFKECISYSTYYGKEWDDYGYYGGRDYRYYPTVRDYERYERELQEERDNGAEETREALRELF